MFKKKTKFFNFDFLQRYRIHYIYQYALVQIVIHGMNGNFKETVHETKFTNTNQHNEKRSIFIEIHKEKFHFLSTALMYYDSD